MHYKKGALVLIIRKILTELPHDLPEVLIFTNANPVKRICSEFMCSHLLLLLDRAPVHTEIASGELSSMQKPVRYTGTGCVRCGPACARLIPLFPRPPINRCRGRFKHRWGAAKHVSQGHIAHTFDEVSILRPPLSLAIALTPAFGLGRPLESTPPSLGRPRGHLNVSAEFLAGESRVVLETMHPRVESR
jgi:hypothetical protein